MFQTHSIRRSSNGQFETQKIDFERVGEYKVGQKLRSSSNEIRTLTLRPHTEKSGQRPDFVRAAGIEPAPADLESAVLTI
jgi:hypothetical protein